MKLKYFSLPILVFSMFAEIAAAGISKNSKINGGDALLIGGAQPGRIIVDGQNRGQTAIELFIQSKDGTKTVATIATGKAFNQSVRKEQTLVIKNLSQSEPAKIYWHVSRYSKFANARSVTLEKR